MTASPLRLAVAVAALSLAAAGCGNKGSNQEVPTSTHKLDIKIEQFGPEVQVNVTKSVDAGVQEIRFTNAAKGKHSAQLIRYDQGHDPTEVLKAGAAWGERHEALAPWVHFLGGFGAIRPGETQTGAVKLES